MAHCRILIDADLAEHTCIPIPDDQAYYLRQVMRLGEGDTITVFNGRGGEYRATIQVLSRQNAECLLESFQDIQREMVRQVHIVQCANRSDKIETILQKGTELGAASFHITSSERSTLKLSGSKLEKRLQRWQKIIIEAAEQSERTIIPTVYWHQQLKDIPAKGACFALHTSDPECSWQVFQTQLMQHEHISLAIGPEGGWSRQDLATLANRSYQPLQFGHRILRTETAAPALLAAIQALLLK